MKDYGKPKKLVLYWIILLGVIVCLPIMYGLQLDAVWILIVASVVGLSSLGLMIQSQMKYCQFTSKKIDNLENRIKASSEITDACLKKIQEKAVSKSNVEIADFLHDFTLGNLSSINLLMSKHIHEHPRATINKEVLITSQNLVLKTYGELRDKVSKLKEEECSEVAIDFVLELETLVQTILQPLGIDAYFNFDRISKFDTLCFETQLEVYQLIRECINNVIKHSKADKLLIEIKGGDQKLEFSFIDNGVGFDGDPKQKGGIQSLKRRIEKKFGSFQIKTSTNGVGTEVKFALPIQ